MMEPSKSLSAGGGSGRRGGAGGIMERWMRLPGGALVRGRRLADDVTPVDFSLVLAAGPLPPWTHRRVRWPDFWVPLDHADAMAALREAHARAYAGERVEAACHGGIGRTGTALAAL